MPRTQKADYEQLVDVFRALVERVVPPEATIAVVSKGDHALLALGERRAWHFPQRSDGAYAGYYPPDSANAIAHLEAVRARGADFIAFPAVALWWLDSYGAFGRHLQSRYHEILTEDDAGAIYALSDAAMSDTQRNSVPAAGPRTTRPNRPATPSTSATSTVEDELLADLHKVFDASYYREQLGLVFATADDALAHYLQARPAAPADPHPLFHTDWYLNRYPSARGAGEAPLVHFLRNGWAEELDPNPLFDTGHYYRQAPALREERRSALVHYIDNAPAGKAAQPNPLFDDSFYIASYRSVLGEAFTPFEHFLRRGCDQGRFGSALHRNMMAPAHRPSGSLSRGNWRSGTALIFTADAGAAGGSLAAALADEYHFGAVVVALTATGDGRNVADGSPCIVLDDYRLAADVFRASALRLLARSLAALRPRCAVSDVAEVLEPLAAAGVRTFHLQHEATDSTAPVRASAWRTSARLSDDHSRVLAAVATSLDAESADRRFARSVTRTTRPRILIPCSDWAVSGVNTSIEAVGRELIDRGWDTEIVFTRCEEAVLQTTGDEHLPGLPYRFLDRPKIGVAGMWEALIAEFEERAPSILLMAYDFLANAVAPALSDRVGVMTWVQADDDDYYEQTYRLGRYCNAVVCVSERIKARVSALNPVIGERAHVIHNSSVSAGDIVRRRPPRGSVMRLAYTGRLVGYQKRVLDFIELARGLDRTGVDYEMSLIGTFDPGENIESAFRRQAEQHLADGRINLRGRMTRTAILEELTAQDFFVLLSDFEGLPLSLIEAMARGCVPIAAASPSGIPDLIDPEQNGLIVTCRDYDRWARLIVDLWRDDSRYARMSRRARATVRDRFTIERVGAQFATLFEQTATEIVTGAYRRPPSLNGGPARTRTGDVLPPPSMHDPADFGWV